jgi:putative ABC transport system substrate-binding protein
VRGCESQLAAAMLSTGPRSGLRRREFVLSICGAALVPLVCPPCARAQSKLPVIGFLGSTTPTTWSVFVGAFVQRLRELGWIDGRNIAIEYRWAEGREDRYAELAAELVGRKVDVVVTAGTPAVVALMKATSTIPIVFASAGAPVETGLVASLARPGGNVTGLSNQQTDLAGKRLEQLRRVVPDLRRVAVMGNVASSIVALEMNAVEVAAPTLGLEAFRVEIRNMEDIAPGIESLKADVDALYVCSDPLLTIYRDRINSLAISKKLPTVSAFRAYVQAGGLMSYGPNFPDLFRRAGDYVDTILRGAKPADIPVEQPIKFDLVINLTTAKALGLQIPDKLLALADEVIE